MLFCCGIYAGSRHLDSSSAAWVDANVKQTAFGDGATTALVAACPWNLQIAADIRACRGHESIAKGFEHPATFHYQYVTAIFVASTNISTAKIFFSVATGSRCVMRAPIGAVMMLPATSAANAGNKTNPK